MKEVSKREYARMARQAAPASKTLKNCLCAFLVGGLICTMGQILRNLFLRWGMELSLAKLAVSVGLIFLSALLTACGVYDSIAKHAGAGTLVPITGFANAMVSPAMEFKSEGYVLGLGAKLFTVSGPVIVFGVTASILYGLLLFVFSLLGGA